MRDSQLARVLSERRDEALAGWQRTLEEQGISFDVTGASEALSAIQLWLSEPESLDTGDIARMAPFGDGETALPQAVVALVTLERVLSGFSVYTGVELADLVAALGKEISDGLARTQAELRDLATTDSLTGAMSRQAVFDALDSEIARAVRHGRSLSVVYLDADLLKQVNDNSGHPAGDRLLKSVVDVVRASCRASDVIGRVGGDEFLLVLPDTPLSGAEIVAARVSALSASAGCPITAGAAGTPRDELDRDRLVEEADAALRRSKATRDGSGKAAG